MNVHEIVKKYLVENGYDGLVDEESECGCLITDLAPCQEIQGICKAAYNHSFTTVFLMSVDKKQEATCRPEK